MVGKTLFSVYYKTSVFVIIKLFYMLNKFTEIDCIYKL